jgi:hypothetical protein
MLHTEFRAYLRRNKISQAAVSRVIGKDRRHVNRWATGRERIPNYVLPILILMSKYGESQIEEEINNITFNWEEVLAIETDEFTMSDIKKSWRDLVRRHHPDIGGREEDIKRINNAYDEAKEQLSSL